MSGSPDSQDNTWESAQNLLPLVVMVDIEAREQDCPPPKVDHPAFNLTAGGDGALHGHGGGSYGDPGQEGLRVLVNCPCLSRVLQEPKHLETLMPRP